MHPTDLIQTLQWWLTIFLFGLGFFPVTLLLFKSFFDKGYLFAKIIALSITSYIIFLFGLLHLAPFTIQTSIGILLGLTLLNYFMLRKKLALLTIIKSSWKIFLLEELIFLGALSFWAYIHAYAPDIHGLEKYMDFGFINSILRSEYFPPKDMWFTPFFINYYYFGHLMTAVLTKLSFLPASVTFNLMLATIFAFCFSFSFSIGANLYTLMQKGILSQIKRFISGILSALLVTFAGNLHILYAFFKAYPNEAPVPWWQLPFLPFTFPNGYWYPNATRFIHNTIHEFPMYSWTVADLHGHVLDIPLVLLTIAVLLSLFISHTSEKRSSQEKLTKKSQKMELIREQKISVLYLVFVGFLLALMYMTNAWDGAIYLILTALVLLYFFWGTTLKIKQFLLSLALVVVSFMLFVLPYNLNFKPFVSGIGLLCSPEFLINLQKLGPLLFEADHCQHSPWWQLLILHGFFLFFITAFVMFIAKTKKVLQSDLFVFLLIIVSLFLILLPEIIYVKDIYPAHYRANTMFKLVFQAFIMLSLVSGYVIVRISTSITKKTTAFFFVLPVTLLVSLILLYPYQAIKGYYGDLTHYKGLEGTTYLQTLYPTDYEAIMWLDKNVNGQPVVLEAQGDSYTDYARVSVNTGLPTVLGWTVHEWLWRGTYDIPAPRIEEIKTMYESTDIAKTKSLLQKYNVKYIFIGTLEHEKYPNLFEEKFKSLGKLVWKKDKTRVYKIMVLE